MIGHFPDPYPDELFYSICSRFSALMGFPSFKATLCELGMSKYASAGVALPQNLDALVAQLPPGHAYSSDLFIDKHTMLPLFAPFFTEEQYVQVRTAMNGNSVGSIHRATVSICHHLYSGSAGVMRFCPGCVANDREIHGEAYWHRVHQICGMDLCLVHRCHLEQARIHLAPCADMFKTAESCIERLEARRIDERNPIHKISLGVANDIAWLFDQTDLPHRPDLIARGYIDLLYERAYYKRFKRAGGFVEKTRRALLSELDGGGDGLVRLSPKFHPLEELWFIRLAGHTAESFFGGIASRATDSQDSVR